MKPFNMELPVMSSVFNLALVDAPDMDRVLEEDRKRIAAECEARAFETKMQKLLELCPGFVGADIPKSENAAGRVVVQPGLAPEAVRWLRRRFQVAENIELSPDDGLAFDIRPRARRGSPKRQKFQGRKAEQFEFEL